MEQATKKLAGQLLIFGILTLAIVAALVASLRISRTRQGGSGLSREYKYDLSAMARTDPKLILFSEVGQAVPTGLTKSHALVADRDGALHVVGDRAVKVFPAQGSPRTVALNFEPRCLAIAEGRYFLAAENRVVEAQFNGDVIKTWPALGPRSLITALVVDEGRVFIADAGERIVWCYDLQGTLQRRIGDKDPEHEILGFVVPTPYFDLALAPDGLLRVVNPGNHRVEAYTPRGDLALWWGAFGNSIEAFTGCCNPVSIAVLSDGRVVACEKGLVRVKLYETDGEFLGVVAGTEQLVEGQATICETPAQCRTGGFDIAVDRNDRVIVLDTVKNVLRTFVEKEGS